MTAPERGQTLAGKGVKRSQCPDEGSTSPPPHVAHPGKPRAVWLVQESPRAPAHLYAVVEGSQSLGLVVLREGSAQTAVPLVPLCTGAMGTAGMSKGARGDQVPGDLLPLTTPKTLGV